MEPAEVDNRFGVLYGLRMRVSVLSCFAWISAVATGLSLDTPPKAAVRTVEDEYFGVKISDPYRWLENIKDSPEAQEWLRAQANYSRKLIDSMPKRMEFVCRVRGWYTHY